MCHILATTQYNILPDANTPKNHAFEFSEVYCRRQKLCPFPLSVLRLQPVSFLLSFNFKKWQCFYFSSSSSHIFTVCRLLNSCSPPKIAMARLPIRLRSRFLHRAGWQANVYPEVSALVPRDWDRSLRPTFNHPTSRSFAGEARTAITIRETVASASSLVCSRRDTLGWL
jgi:hypothetical protein